MQDKKTKSMIKFDSGSSIKSVATQMNPNVKITTHLMKGEMLMFTKTSFISFVYDTINVFLNKIRKCKQFMTSVRYKNVFCTKM